MRIENSRFSDQRVQVDGNEYIGCRFENCELSYAASAGVGLVDCTFINVKWRMEGAAARTMKFLQAIYHGGGRELVEKTFDEIRRSQAA
jgi:hypothetical protein